MSTPTLIHPTLGPLFSCPEEKEIPPPFSPELHQAETPRPSPVRNEPPRLLTEDEIEEVLSGLKWPTRYVNYQEFQTELAKPHPSFLPVEPYTYCVDPRGDPNNPEIKVKVFIRGRYGIPGAAENVGYRALESMRENLRVRLRGKKVHPSKIEDLKRVIRYKYFAAQVNSGSSVGILAEEALGAPIMQLTLNSFRLQGVIRKFSSSLTALTEIINASRRRSRPMTVISLKNPPGRILSLPEAIKLIPEIDDLTVGNLVTNPSIETRTSIHDSWIFYYHNLSQRPEMAGLIPPIPQEIVNPNQPASANVLILDLNRTRMFNAGITVNRLVQEINRVSQGIVTVIPTPLHEGRLYLFANPQAASSQLSASKEFKETFANLAGDFSSVYFRSILIPTLDDLRLRGIAGLHNFTPEAFPIWGVVAETVKLSRNRYQIIWAIDFIRRTGVGPERVIDLFDKAGIRILPPASTDRPIVTSGGAYPRDLIIETPDGVYTQEKVAKPSEVLRLRGFGELPPGVEETEFEGQRFLLRGSEELLSELTPRLRRAEIEILRQIPTEISVKTPEGLFRQGREVFSPEEILDAKGLINDPENPEGYYLTGTVEGTNLLELFDQDFVDFRYTFSHDMHEIMRVLGVEAVRNFIIHSILEILRHNGNYIDPRAIVSLADFMTNNGVPTSISYSGTLRQRMGPLTKSYVQEPYANSLRGGIVGQSEQVKNVSTNVAVGQLTPQGTGAIDTLRTETGRIYRGRELPERPPSVSAQDLENALENLEQGVGAPPEPGQQFPQVSPHYGQVSVVRTEAEDPVRMVATLTPRYPPNLSRPFLSVLENVRSNFRRVRPVEQQPWTEVPADRETLPNPRGSLPPAIPIDGRGLPAGIRVVINQILPEIQPIQTPTPPVGEIQLVGQFPQEPAQQIPPAEQLTPTRQLPPLS